MILTGVLLPGARLPSTRTVADQCHVARNTVIAAYDTLQSEGYLTAERGGGTRVGSQLPEHCLHTDAPASASEAPRARRPKLEPRRHLPELAVPEMDDRAALIDLVPGKSNPAHFPARLVRQAGDEALKGATHHLTNYQDLQGFPPLRAEIAAFLATNRGLRTSPSQIIMTAGIQEALNLVAHLFAGPELTVALENPCYQSPLYIFRTYGARIAPIDVDEEGIQVEKLKETDAKLAYLTPSHQFPMGVTLSQARRGAALAWAEETGAFLIEDDYDSDFRYETAPLPSLAGTDTGGNVIYLGTVSKSLGPGFRVGYIVSPPSLVDAFGRLKALTSLGGNALEQRIVANLFASGAYQRHLRHLRQSYKAARDLLIAEIERHFGPQHLLGRDCGMHLVWPLPDDFPEAEAVAEAARQKGTRIHTLASAGAVDFGSAYAGRALIFGYSSVSDKHIVTGISAVAEAISDLMARKKM